MTTDELTYLIFDKLNFNVNGTGGLHPLDEDRIKGLYKALYGDGKELNIDLLNSLARQKHWADSAIKFLIEKAEHVSKGGRVQLKYDKTIGATFYEKIIEST